MTILFNSRTPEWAWLSNFEPCVLKIRLGEADDDPVQVFPSAEHLYQFSKWDRRDITRLDVMRGARALCYREPAEAKRWGRHIVLRPGWQTIKLRLMAQILREKFAQNPHLADRLRATGNQLLWHLSPWDMYWGGTENRAGLNRLGLLLMARRNALSAKPRPGLAEASRSSLS